MSSDAVAEMAFIDLAFHQNDERSDVVQFRVKLRVKKNDNLRIVLGRAVRKLLLNEETEINKSGEVEDDGDVSALTNLSDLPSHKTESEKGLTKTEKGKRDTKIAKELGKNIFAARSVRSFVTCYHCCKRRCIYSPSQEGYIQAQAARALKEKLESVSGRYSCGDLLFEDSDPLSKVLVQKLNLTCESQIEKGYYNNASDTRSLNLKDICIHCGELDMNETGMHFSFGRISCLNSV